MIGLAAFPASTSPMIPTSSLVDSVSRTACDDLPQERARAEAIEEEFDFSNEVRSA